MRSQLRSVVFLLASVALPGTALAAADDGADAADAADAAALITVTAPRDQGYAVRSTGTATRTDTPLLDVPQSLTVLTRDRLDDQALLSIGDALRYVPGATNGQGEGHRDQPTLRGNSSTADFFVDGMRDDVQYYRDFYNIERLEILKGPNAMTFGRGGGGGVINRVAKTPGAQRHLGADAAVDSFGAWRVTADLDTPLAAGVAARLNGFYEDGANHRDVYDLERWGINPTLGFDLGGNGNIVLGYEHVSDDRVVDRGVPSRAGRPAEGFRDTFFGDADRNRSTFNADILSFAVDYAFSDSLKIRNRTRYGDFDKLYVNVFPATPITAAGTIGVEAYADGTQRENFFTQTDLVWETTTGSIGHTLLIGTEFGRQTTRSQRINGLFPGNVLRTSVAVTDPFRPPAAVFGAPLRSVRTRADIAAVFIQDQFDLGEHVQLLAGLRYDRFSLDFGNSLNGTGFSRTDNLWSPRLGVVVKPVANASLYASYSRSYLPQSGDQFVALDASLATLEPERFENLEVGAKWDIIPDLNLTAALYRLDRTNTRAPGAVAGTIELTGEQRSKGLELAANGQITPAWQVSAGFAWQDAELRTTTAAAPAGRKVPLVPRTQASLWTRYDFGDRIGLGLGVVHQASSFASISNAVVLPAYTRIDTAAFLRVTDGIDVQVNVENLFNTGYFPTAHNDNNISTGGPRSARFTVRTKF
ncbi:MAG: TonB-dependent siderophore receptor [Alphaproteobacteria bacterium]|nr:MAG: TonB-dependent siderophore receptor [Alphaproteobacteria bacterium]